MTARPLQRVLGMPTAWLIGMGVAIGSGIFRTPGEVAGHFGAPGLIALAWVLGGVMVLCQCLVSAELATRFPQAGGEYVYLKHAYGRFAAFFFGWAYTVFILGGGAALIARALGDFACVLFAVDPRWSGVFAAGAIAVVIGVNAAGLKTGAGTQNTLTALKIAALVTLIVLGFGWGSRPLDLRAAASAGDAAAVAAHVPEASSAQAVEPAANHANAKEGPGDRPTGVFPWVAVFLAGLLPVLWSYDGATDSVKMAEEVRDVRRALPRALIGSGLSLIVLYVLVNLALLRVMPADEMRDYASVPGEAMNRLFGPTGRNAALIAAVLVCLGALSSTLLAPIRVTYALARDGLTFSFLGRMSKSQAPVAALLVVGGFAIVVAMRREFSEVLGIYYFASAILFGMAYASLIVFRVREAVFPERAFRCPAGVVLAAVLILVQLALAVNIALGQPWDVLWSALLLVGLGGLYFVWRRKGAE